MTPKAVVFAYHDVGARCLRVLRAHGVDVPLVVTHADDPSEIQWFERVADVADDFLARGQRLTAGDIYKRASVLTAYAEWTMLLSPEKHRAFDRGRELALKAMDLLGERGESVKIPY